MPRRFFIVLKMGAFKFNLVAVLGIALIYQWCGGATGLFQSGRTLAGQA